MKNLSLVNKQYLFSNAVNSSSSFVWFGGKNTKKTLKILSVLTKLNISHTILRCIRQSKANTFMSVKITRIIVSIILPIFETLETKI